MATPDPRLSNIGFEIGKQDSGEMVHLCPPADSWLLPLSVRYSAIRDLSDWISEDGGDVLGVAIGTNSASGVIVQRFELLRGAPGNNLNDAAGVLESMRQMVERCARESPQEGRPVGLFRTQLGGWASLNDFDSRLVRCCLPFLAPTGKFFLVIRDFPHRPRSSAIFPLDQAPMATSRRPVLEFPFDEYLLRKGYLTDAPDPAATPLAAPAPMEMADPPPQPGSGSRFLVAGLVLLAVFAGAGAWKWSQSPVRPARENAAEEVPPTHNLSLKVARSGKDMEISWNRLSEVVAGAVGGTLTIRDGAMVRVVALNSGQLRQGGIWFAPPTGSDLDLRLEISQKSGKTEVETVQVLNWDSVAPIAAPPGTSPSYADRLESAPAQVKKKAAPARKKSRNSRPPKAQKGVQASRAQRLPQRADPR